MEQVCNLASEAKIPAYLSSKVVTTTNHLMNLSPAKANHGVIPKAKYSKTKPIIEHLRVFDCIAYVHISKENRKKNTKCLFLRYNDKSKVYGLFDYFRKKILLSRNIDKNKVGYDQLAHDLIEFDIIFPLITRRQKGPNYVQDPTTKFQLLGADDNYKVEEPLDPSINS